MKYPLITLALAALSFSNLAHAEGAPVAAEATPEHTLSGNLSLSSDYRFRGISQTWRLPAVQGGLDYAHRTGFYAGTWASNVSGNSYNNGAGLELDLYGGFKTALSKLDGQDLTLDLGALAYVYPGATLNSAPGVATDKKYTNVDLYAALSLGSFSAKLSIAALETLAVIAYKQPVTIPEILEIRGVSSSSAIKTLLDKRLIVAKGRKKVVGRPMMYGTSKEFLLQFGLNDLTELPNLEDFEDLMTS